MSYKISLLNKPQIDKQKLEYNSLVVKLGHEPFPKRDILAEAVA